MIAFTQAAVEAPDGGEQSCRDDTAWLETTIDSSFMTMSTDRQTDRRTNGQTYSDTDKDKHIDRKTDRQTDRQANKHIQTATDTDRLKQTN